MAKKEAKAKVETEAVTTDVAKKLKELEAREKAVAAKEAALNGPVVSGETIKMIWPGKYVTPGEKQNCFGMEGTANEEGFLVVDCPKEKVKNELKRKPQSLIPLDLYEERKEAQAAFDKQYSEY